LIERAVRKKVLAQKPYGDIDYVDARVGTITRSRCLLPAREISMQSARGCSRFDPQRSRVRAYHCRADAA
jgi:hypothetical protein